MTRQRERGEAGISETDASESGPRGWDMPDLAAPDGGIYLRLWNRPL